MSKKSDRKKVKSLPSSKDNSPIKNNDDKILSFIQQLNYDELSESAYYYVLNRQFSDGQTPLIHAVRTGKTQMVKLLLKAGANVNYPNKYGITPLAEAVSHNYDLVAKLLIQSGANPTLVDIAGNSPLSLCVTLNKSTLLKFCYINDVEVFNNKDKNGNTTLINAVISGCIDVVNILVECNINIINHHDKSGRTPLIIASQQNDYKILRILIENDADIDYQDQNKNFALDYAIKAGATECVEILVENNAPFSCKNSLASNSQISNLVQAAIICDQTYYGGESIDCGQFLASYFDVFIHRLKNKIIREGTGDYANVREFFNAYKEKYQKLVPQKLLDLISEELMTLHGVLKLELIGQARKASYDLYKIVKDRGDTLEKMLNSSVLATKILAIDTKKLLGVDIGLGKALEDLKYKYELCDHLSLLATQISKKSFLHSKKSAYSQKSTISNQIEYTNILDDQDKILSLMKEDKFFATHVHNLAVKIPTYKPVFLMLEEQLLSSKQLIILSVSSTSSPQDDGILLSVVNNINSLGDRGYSSITLDIEPMGINDDS